MMVGLLVGREHRESCLVSSCHFKLLDIAKISVNSDGNKYEAYGGTDQANSVRLISDLLIQRYSHRICLAASADARHRMGHTIVWRSSGKKKRWFSVGAA